jgi:hypothetical protein
MNKQEMLRLLTEVEFSRFNQRDRDAIEAIRDFITRAVIVPDRWQLMPKEPETEMINAGKKAFFDMLQNNTFAFATMYQAMLAAAPAPESK